MNHAGVTTISKTTKTPAKILTDGEIPISIPEFKSLRAKGLSVPVILKTKPSELRKILTSQGITQR
jgi:hypothetical protein